MILDKTGTVTTGEMVLHDVVPAADVEADDVLRTAGALEAASEHPALRPPDPPDPAKCAS